MTPLESDTTCTLSLRHIASWQFPALATDSQGQHPPVRAGLPSLQRGAVWRPNQVELLWDSILRGFPIGSLVVSPMLKRQKTRSGAHADDLPSGDAYTHHLLDGQQRANAIALGYLHPSFAPATDKQTAPKTLLWLDLAPLGLEQPSLKSVPGFESSTRSYLLRVTTEAHPWGFKVSDEKEPRRLEHGQAQQAKAVFLDSQGNAHDRPLPHQGWPIDANVPIPLAWALEAAHQVSDRQAATPANEAPERALWEAVRQRCKAPGPQAATEESTKENPRFTPWAPRAVHVLEHWLNAATLPLQAQYLARGLLRALKARMVALAIAPEALEAPYRPTEKSEQESSVPIANVEHLFQRLNGGGTDLSAEDRAYSMIKAYWPGVEHTIAAIQPRPPETQVALLGTRLGLDVAQQAEGKNTLPTQPSVSSLRQLAAVRAEGGKKAHELMAQRQQIRTMFGLQEAEDSNNRPISPAPIQKAVEQWDRWFLYTEDHPWGLPPVLRSRMASQAPEVFLFLLRLAHHAVSVAPDMPAPSESTLKKLLGLATAVHWFGLEREKAVGWLWAIPPAQWLDGSAFTAHKHLLSQVRDLGPEPDPQKKPSMAHILHPDELARYIHPDTLRTGPLADWRWWNQPGRLEALAGNANATGEDPSNAAPARWAQYADCINIVARRDYRGTNVLLLMYAQREQMQHFFSCYDPQDADFWAAHNVPWDFDHLLQQNAFTNKKSENAFMWVCQEWGRTIANLHLLPFTQNRSRQDDPLESSLPSDESERNQFLQRIHLAPDTPSQAAAANRLSAFSMESDAIRSNVEGAEQRVTAFVLASRERLLRLYGDWFDTLQIGSLL